MSIDAYFTFVTYLMAGLFGLTVGSFLNVVIYRVPLGMSLAKPASHCPKCNTPIRWYDNIPVLSYLLLKGKCRTCKTPISFRYTAVEITNALLWLFSVYRFLPSGILAVCLSAITVSLLLCVFFIDWENKIIPDRFQIMLGVLAVIYTVYDLDAWLWHVLGGVIGFSIMWLIGFAGEKIAKREALGGGDIKLCGVMGLLLGLQNFWLAMLFASVSACVILLFTRKKAEREIPFAPFLTTGFALSLFFGNSVISWYLSILLE